MEYNKKVIVIGDVGVGKTSFVARVTEGRFISEHKSTIGVDCAVKTIHKSDNTVVRVVLWDIGGQDTFRAMMPQYARSSAGIIIVCDVTNQKTVDAVRVWKTDADKVLLKKPPCILLVNKFDLPKHIHCVNNSQLDQLSEECNIRGWYQTSVKENINLLVALDELADLMLQDKSDIDDDNLDTFKLEDDNKPLQRHYFEKSRCCDL